MRKGGDLQLRCLNILKSRNLRPILKGKAIAAYAF